MQWEHLGIQIKQNVQDRYFQSSEIQERVFHLAPMRTKSAGST